MNNQIDSVILSDVLDLGKIKSSLAIFFFQF